MIIALDPGKVTGLAVWSPKDPLAIATREVSPLDAIEYVDAAHARNQGAIEVVAEKFTISERTIKTALSLDALDVNGWLTMESQRKLFPLHMQLPSQAKAFATDDKLRVLGWYTKTKDGHANDAARHMLTHLISVPEYRAILLPTLAKEIL